LTLVGREPTIGEARVTTGSQTLSLQSPLPADSKLFRFWREELARFVIGLDVTPLGDGPIAIESRIGQFDDLIYADWKSSPLLSARDQALIADGKDCFSLTIPRRGRLFLSQRGSEEYQAEGWTRFLRLGEPCRWGSHEAIDAPSIMFPIKRLQERLPDINDRLAKPLSLADGTGRLLSNYYALVEKHLDESDEAVKRAMAAHLVDLAVLALAPTRDARESARNGGLKMLRREAVLQHIAKSVADPKLNLVGAAAKLGLSPRYVQLLLEESGTSFTRKVREARIAHAAALLLNKHYDHLRIADIAFETGFSDISSFNRAFRQRIGDTPGAVRAARPV
jgi:AraC-like DNA-binding protein